MPPEAQSWLLSGIGTGLFALASFFLKGLASDFRTTAARVEQVVGTLGQHTQRFEGLERTVGKLEGKLEMAQQQRSEDVASIAVLQQRCTQLEASAETYHRKANELQAALRGSKRDT